MMMIERMIRQLVQFLPALRGLLGPLQPLYPSLKFLLNLSRQQVQKVKGSRSAHLSQNLTTSMPLSGQHHNLMQPGHLNPLHLVAQNTLIQPTRRKSWRMSTTKSSPCPHGLQRSGPSSRTATRTLTRLGLHLGKSFLGSKVMDWPDLSACQRTSDISEWFTNFCHLNVIFNFLCYLLARQMIVICQL